MEGYSRYSLLSLESDSTQTEIRPHQQEAGIFVSEIARGTTDKQLFDAFSKYNIPIVSAKVIRGHNGATKGYGFLKLGSHEDASALLQLDSIPRFRDEVTDLLVPVKISLEEPRTTLYVVNLVTELPRDVIKTELEELCKVEMVDLIYNHHYARAHLTFMTHEDAVTALHAIHKKLWRNNLLCAYFTKPAPDFGSRAAQQVKSLFIKGLPKDATVEVLMELFNSRNLSVQSIVIPIDERRGTKEQLGHAFIYFNSREDAIKAIKADEPYVIDGQNITLEWCYPRPIHNRSSNSSYHNYGSNHHHYSYNASGHLGNFVNNGNTNSSHPVARHHSYYPYVHRNEYGDRSSSSIHRLPPTNRYYGNSGSSNMFYNHHSYGDPPPPLAYHHNNYPIGGNDNPAYHHQPSPPFEFNNLPNYRKSNSGAPGFSKIRSDPGRASSLYYYPKRVF